MLFRCMWRSLLIAVYNSWGSSTKRLTSVASMNCVKIMVMKYFECLGNDVFFVEVAINLFAHFCCLSMLYMY